MNLKEIKIKINDANQRLDRFLLKNFPNLSRIAVYKIIRTKDVKVNHKKVDHNYLLKENDVVSIYAKENFLEKKVDLSFANAKDELDIIYEDKNILVVHKPIGLIVHEDNRYKNDTLQNRIKKYLVKKDEYHPFDESAFVPSLCHRLDLNTSGLIVAAKTANALRVITEMFKNNDVIRIYKCLTYNQLPKNNDVIYNFMYKADDNTMIVQNFKTKFNKTAITKYTYIDKYKKYFIYDIELLTGRTHQIRAVLNFLHAPIVGEQKYITKDSDKNQNYMYQCLVSYKIKFINLKKYQCEELNYLENKEFRIKNIWFLK
ncbi:RluA family pseudouridine synthase [Ureaplasma parvum]|nr:RluA family pseudouridine synthase [Ureaplasma parvum]